MPYKHIAAKWTVKVTENGAPAYNRSFRTRRIAADFIMKAATTHGTKWRFELSKIAPVNLGRVVVDDTDDGDPGVLLDDLDEATA